MTNASMQFKPRILKQILNKAQSNVQTCYTDNCCIINQCTRFKLSISVYARTKHRKFQKDAITNKTGKSKRLISNSKTVENQPVRLNVVDMLNMVVSLRHTRMCAHMQACTCVHTHTHTQSVRLQWGEYYMYYIYINSPKQTAFISVAMAVNFKA